MPRPRQTRRPTLKDVASQAGVSLSTASLAFSGNKPVSPATRERVLSAALMNVFLLIGQFYSYRKGRRVVEWEKP